MLIITSISGNADEPRNAALCKIDNITLHIKYKSLAVASIARDVGSSSTNRSSDIKHLIIKSN